MKILQLIDTLEIGGAERMCVNIATTLTGAGTVNCVVTSRTGGALRQYLPGSTAYYNLGKKNGLDLPAFRRFFLLVKKLKPDIIHAHSTSIFWAMALKAFYPGIKIIWHDHYGLSDTLRQGDRFGHRFVSRWIDGVVVVNKQLEEWGTSNLHVKRSNILFLKNFPFLQLDKNLVKEEKPVLLNLANFRPQKDQLTLIKAVSLVRDAGVEFELWLAGAFVDRSWADEVAQAIRAHQLQDSVKILGPVNDSAEVLNKAFAGILSSSSEGLPVALLEYGLAALPVICTDTGECRQVLGNGKFGIVVPPSDASALAAAITSLLQDKAAASIMADKFHQHVKTTYGSTSFLNGYLPFIERLVHEKQH